MNMKKALLKVSIVLTLFLMQVAAPFSLSAESLYDYNFTIDNVITRAYVNSEAIPDSTGFKNYITFYFDGEYEGTAKFTYQYRLGSNTTYTTNSRTMAFSGSSVTHVLNTTGQAVNYLYCTVTAVENANVRRLSNHTQDFPWESYPIQSFNLSNNPVVGIDYRFDYLFNIFDIYGYLDDRYSSSTGYCPLHQFYGYKDQAYYFIFWMDKNVYSSTYNNFLGFQSGTSGANVVVNECKVLNRFHYDGHTTSLVKMTITPTLNAGYSIRYVNEDNCLYMPVYFNLADYEAISTDFALRFDLTNRLLNDLESIAGNQVSDEAAENLDDNAADMQDAFDDMFSVENGYNNQLNTELQNIDFSNPIQNNTSMLSSGNFVISIFNGLIANNPITILIVIMAILMVARRLFG